MTKNDLATTTARRSRTRRTKSSAQEIAERRRDAFNRLKAFQKEYEAMTPEQQQAINTAAAKLGAYSDRNKMLIYMQAMHKGFEPSAVCPFSVWKKVGRVVKKGEHGLEILAPCIKKGKEAPTADDCALVEYGHDFTTDDLLAEPSVNFRTVYVFDISQTELLAGYEGNELPAPEEEPAALPAPAAEASGQLLLDLGAA